MSTTPSISSKWTTTSQIVEHKKKKKTTTNYGEGYACTGLGILITCDGIKPVNGFPTPLDYWISVGNTYKQIKQIQPARVHFHSKRPHIITYEGQHTYGQYNSRVCECS